MGGIVPSSIFKFSSVHPLVTRNVDSKNHAKNQSQNHQIIGTKNSRRTSQAPGAL